MGCNPADVNRVTLKHDHVSLLNQFNQLCSALYFYGASKFSFFDIRHCVEIRVARLIYTFLLDGIIEKDFNTAEETLWLFISSVDSDLSSPEKSNNTYQSTTTTQLPSTILTSSSSHLQSDFCQSSLLSWLLICCHRGVLAKKLKSGLKKQRCLLAKYYSRRSLIRCPLHRPLLIAYIQTIEEYRPEQLAYLRLMMFTGECVDFTDDITFGEEATEDLVIIKSEYSDIDESTKKGVVLSKIFIPSTGEDDSTKSIFSKESGSKISVDDDRRDSLAVETHSYKSQSPNTCSPHDGVSPSSSPSVASHQNSPIEKPSRLNIPPAKVRSHRRIQSDLTDLQSHFSHKNFPVQTDSPPVYSTADFIETGITGGHPSQRYGLPGTSDIPSHTAIHNPDVTSSLSSIMDFSATMERDVAHFELAERLISGMESLYCDRTLSRLRLHNLPSTELLLSLDYNENSLIERLEGTCKRTSSKPPPRFSQKGMLQTSYSLQNLSHINCAPPHGGISPSRQSTVALNRYWQEMSKSNLPFTDLSASVSTLHSTIARDSDAESTTSTIDVPDVSHHIANPHVELNSISRAHHISAKLLEMVKLTPEESMSPDIQRILMRPGMTLHSSQIPFIHSGRKDSISTDCLSPPPTYYGSMTLSPTNPSGPPSFTKSISSQSVLPPRLLMDNQTRSFTSSYTKKSVDDTVWDAPKFEIIVHCVSKNKRSEVLKQQNNRCAGCGMNVDSACLKRLRFCEYYGKFFCSMCHTNTLMLVPGHVIQSFDLSMLPVSNFAHDVLDTIFHKHLFNLRELNPNLLKNRDIKQVERLKTQLKHLWPFMETCRDCAPIVALLSEQRKHWFENDIYTMHDFELLRQRQLIEKLRRLVLKCTDHIKACPLCQARGFFCELCQDKSVIFTFQTRITTQCLHCGALFHTHCLNKYRQQWDACPRCQRLHERRRRLGNSEQRSSDFDDVVEEDLLIESKEEDANSVNTIT